MKVYMPQELQEGDLFFSGLKRQYEAVKASFVTDFLEADILINSPQDPLHYQKKFVFGKELKERGATLYFAYEDIDKSISVLEEFSGLKKVRKEVELFERLEKDQKRVNKYKKISKEAKSHEELINEITLDFYSYFIDKDRDLELLSFCDEILSVVQEKIDQAKIEVISTFEDIPLDGVLINLEGQLIFIDTLNEEIDLILASLIFTLFESREKLSQESFIDWDQVLLNLSYPVVMFAKDTGQLTLHSSGFTKLKIMLRDCLSLRNGQAIDIEGQTYEVVRYDVFIKDKEYIAVAFHSKENTGKLISSEELGIISSSIAHELNNPIAGILASLQLLKLEDDLDEETQKVIDEMEEGTKRCQDLIQIFLGFSRVRPGANVSSSMKDSFASALNMLRFRMVESDIRFVFERLESSESFKREVNSSIMTMIYYLFFNEVLTLHSHYQLVSDDNSRVINGKVKEYSDRVHIGFPDLSIKRMGEKISSLKLIQHLFDLANLVVEFDNERIVIKEKR